MKTMYRTAKSASAAALFVCTIVALPHITQAQTWVASTGTVDSSSLLTYQFKDGAAFVRSGLHSGTVTLRYNVLPVGDLIVPLGSACCEGWTLLVRFLDNGNGAHVIVKLKQYNVITGAITTHITFDSKNSPPASTFQAALADPASLGSFFDFSFADGPFSAAMNQGGDSVYYIEATLIRTRPTGTPGLASISIVKTLAP